MPSLTNSFLFLSFGVVLCRTAFVGKLVRGTDNLLESYDYIVVGGGTSGLVVANRLSEDPTTTVLIIEAGDFDKNEDFITIPILSTGNVPALGNGPRGTVYDWNLTTTPQSTLLNRSYTTPAGKVIGGGTVLNGMVYNRGSKADYDRWETLGNPGWNFEGLLPYFKKAEKFTPADHKEQVKWGISYVPEYHGESGDVDVSFSNFVWPISANIETAMHELQVPILKDSAGGNNTGAFWFSLSLDPADEERSTSQGFYTPDRPNLHLLTESQVTKLVINESNTSVPVVEGVEYSTGTDEALYSISISKEVILAAGTLHTPQLLQLSGIGDGILLSSLGIKTFVDLPGVGANYQDHPLLFTGQTVNIAIQSGNFTNATWNAEMRKLYDEKREGPYTTAGGNQLAFLPLISFSNNTNSFTSTATSQLPAQYLPANSSQTVVAGYKAQHELLTDEITSSASANHEFIFGSTAILPCHHKPFSRGTVTINTTSPFASPLIDSRYFSNPLDLQILVDAFKYTREVRATEALQSIQTVEVFPGESVSTDDEIEAFILQNINTENHHGGTAAMLPRNLGGVVDSELKVYGVVGLRVVDASMMPMLPAAHLQATVYAVAEKAADLIKSQ